MNRRQTIRRVLAGVLIAIALAAACAAIAIVTSLIF